VTAIASIFTLALAPVQQDYLLEARQMQALSFAPIGGTRHVTG
jgi:hypothetical protein